LKVRAVVFDLGKVLVDFDYGIAVRKLAENSVASVEEIRHVIDQSPLLFRYEGGQMSTQDFFEEVRRLIGFRSEFPEFAAAFADIFSEMPEMIQLQAELRARGLPTFILSNTNDIAVRHIRRRFPFFAEFTGYVLSYEQNALKPHRKIYEITEQHAGVSGGEILFLDDRAENVEGAGKLGWQTICHRAAEESIGKVRALTSSSQRLRGSGKQL
jgi:epoxide hydrolase-like predicted phosphatase